MRRIIFLLIAAAASLPTLAAAFAASVSMSIQSLPICVATDLQLQPTVMNIF